MKDLRHFSLFLDSGILFSILGGDALLYFVGGNRSTISRTYLDFEGHRPVMAFALAYAAAVLVWHLSCPTFAPALSWAMELVRAIIVLLPILGTFLLISLSSPTTDVGIIKYMRETPYSAETLVVMGTALGYVAARFGVPQHI